jgi:hypothetical protein
MTCLKCSSVHGINAYLHVVSELFELFYYVTSYKETDNQLPEKQIFFKIVSC